MASCANIKPAKGAPKPEEIDAATPAPIYRSGVKLKGIFCFNHAPSVVPKCTSGPYCPILAPPLAEKKAAKVLTIPTLTSVSLFDLWAR